MTAYPPSRLKDAAFFITMYYLIRNLNLNLKAQEKGQEGANHHALEPSTGRKATPEMPTSYIYTSFVFVFLWQVRLRRRN